MAVRLLKYLVLLVVVVTGCREERSLTLVPGTYPADEPPVSGHLKVPVLLVMYRDTDEAEVRAAAPRDILERRLFSPDVPPYSITSYYREQSNGLLTVSGDVYDWKRVEGESSSYFPNEENRLIFQAVRAWDAEVDFGLYDNDGPDGRPNSGDDDGNVDALVIVHPKVDGACALWDPTIDTTFVAHRSQAPSLRTNDIGQNGDEPIRIVNYIIVGAQGGDSGCVKGEPQSMAILAHELGHILGLPELYDARRPPGPGIGRWGLMGVGNLQIPTRPVNLSAWSKAQLGWVAEMVVDRDMVLDISPIATSDTSYIVPLRGKGEYLILSNRQPLGADSSLIDPSPFGGVLGPGLLIWRADPAAMRERGLGAGDCWKPRANLCRNRVATVRNSVNTTKYGLLLNPADAPVDRTAFPLDSTVSDPGDPYPGSTGRATFCYPVDSDDCRDASVIIDRIRQKPNGTIQARIRFVGDGARRTK